MAKKRKKKSKLIHTIDIEEAGPLYFYIANFSAVFFLLLVEVAL